VSDPPDHEHLPITSDGRLYACLLCEAAGERVESRGLAPWIEWSDRPPTRDG
jgi:hypothetical protein